MRGGKFTQTFGIAWDTAPGIWGTDFAEDYELSEQIGIAADAGFGSATAGRHTVTMGTFFADTTVLSESAVANRGRTRRTDGGAGNTENFSSYALALEGSEIAALPGFGYHLAYASRGTGQPGETRETGFAAALSYAAMIDGIDVAPLVEWVRFNDRDGTPGTDVTYLTTGIGLTWGKWNLALSRTAREQEAAGGSDSDDNLAQISAGYAFDNGIGFNIGYRHSKESGRATDTYGFLVDYAVAF